VADFCGTLEARVYTSMKSSWQWANSDAQERETHPLIDFRVRAAGLGFLSDTTCTKYDNYL
jgi:hypothetical protein